MTILEAICFLGCENYLEVCFMKQQIAYDRAGQPYTRLIIETHEERLAHIEACKARDLNSRWGLVESEEYYERVGDHASVNSWYYHDHSIGFHRLFANTPDWVLKTAIRLGWISECGERILES